MNGAQTVLNADATSMVTTLLYTTTGGVIALVAAITSMVMLFQQLSAINQVPPKHLPLFFLVTLILTSLPWLVSGWGAMLFLNMTS